MARTAPRQPGAPAGVIFGCNRSSEEESLNGLFGMSSGHWSLVKEIIPGTPCFLFNFNTKVGFLADAQNFAGCSAFVYAVATLQTSNAVIRILDLVSFMPYSSLKQVTQATAC